MKNKIVEILDYVHQQNLQSKKIVHIPHFSYSIITTTCGLSLSKILQFLPKTVSLEVLSFIAMIVVE